MTIFSIILGVQNSGKSMLAARLAGQEFINEYQTTTGIDHKSIKLKNNSAEIFNEDIELQIWDTSGAEIYKPIIKTYAVRKNIYYFVIDPTQEIEPQIAYLISFLDPEHIKIGDVCNLVITKSDIFKTKEKFNSNLEKIEEFKQTLIMHYQLKCESIDISAKDNIGIESLRTLTINQYLATVDNSISYIQLFKYLSSTPNMEEYKQDRDMALAIFERELKLAGNNLDKIQKLITDSEPFINRHRHPTRDFIFRKKITNTWSECLRKARDKAIASLEEKVNNNDPTVTEETLSYWKTQSLFAKHRNNSILKGAIFNTEAQNKIEDLKWEIYFRH